MLIVRHRIFPRWDLISLAAAVVMMAGCNALSKHHQIGNEKKGSAAIGAGTVIKATVRSTLGATARAPVTSTRTGAIVLYDRLHSLVVGGAPLPKIAGQQRDALPRQAGGEEFEALLDQEKLPLRTLGSVQLYVDGGSFFPAYFRALSDARLGIDAQTYIFDNDDFAVQVADALKAKSKDVPVRVYFDGSGSMQAAAKPPPAQPPGFKPPTDIGHYLSNGSAVTSRRTLNPYFVADHTKLHIIDERAAFVGGMNIGREYRSHWHDLMARVEGPVVQELMRVFENNWRGDTWWRKFETAQRARGQATAIEPQPQLQASNSQQPLRVLLTDARNGKRDVLKAALLAFRCASRRIWIQTPYFSSDAVTAELEQALKRGVDVRIVIPGDNESELMEANNAEELTRLIEMGAKVYAYPGMTHLKATVCDDWAMVGSANYDTLSMRLNRELNLAISDRKMVDLLATKVFAKDFGVSRRVTPQMARKRGGVFAELIGDQL